MTSASLVMERFGRSVQRPELLFRANDRTIADHKVARRWRTAVGFGISLGRGCLGVNRCLAGRIVTKRHNHSRATEARIASCIRDLDDDQIDPSVSVLPSFGSQAQGANVN